MVHRNKFAASTYTIPKMIVIDTTPLTVLLVGLMQPELIAKTKRTSIYEKEDFDLLLANISSLTDLIVLPNVWTEVDNLLNGFNNSLKWPYITSIRSLIAKTTETYLESNIGATTDYFIGVGLTDSLILEIAKRTGKVVTADTRLADLARAHNIQVYDMVEVRNARLKGKR